MAKKQKDPAFLFYPNDWLGGTMHLDFECKGAYMDLLMLQFNRPIGSPHMTEHMIQHMLLQKFEIIWPKIKDKFIETPLGYYNQRLEDERMKRINYSESRRNNRSVKNVIEKGGTYDTTYDTTYDKDMKNICKTYEKHMENENEDINTDSKDRGIGGMGEKGKGKKSFVPPKVDEVVEFFVERGYRPDVGSKAWEYYSLADWKDSTGKAVKNWKQKMVAVWFKPENQDRVNSAEGNPFGDKTIHPRFNP